jgi:hypothetical protein
MSQTNSVAKSLHDIGLAAWVGGSLFGAVGLNSASAEVSDPSDRAHVANAGWARWTPVNFAAIVAHLIGGAQIVRGNKSRIKYQQGVGSASAIKAGLTAGALGATAYSRILGQKLMDAEAQQQQGALGPDGLPVSDATTPSSDTPEDAAKAQKQLKMLQYAIPALTGGLLVLNARMDEQYRPTEVARGVVGRLVPDALQR